jgi:hypothetical protein
MKARLVSPAGTAPDGLPSVFGALIADETPKWAKVVNSREPSRVTRRWVPVIGTTGTGVPIVLLSRA